MKSLASLIRSRGLELVAWVWAGVAVLLAATTFGTAYRQRPTVERLIPGTVESHDKDSMTKEPAAGQLADVLLRIDGTVAPPTPTAPATLPRPPVPAAPPAPPLVLRGIVWTNPVSVVLEGLSLPAGGALLHLDVPRGDLRVTAVHGDSVSIQERDTTWHLVLARQTP